MDEKSNQDRLQEIEQRIKEGEKAALLREMDKKLDELSKTTEKYTQALEKQKQGYETPEDRKTRMDTLYQVSQLRHDVQDLQEQYQGYDRNREQSHDRDR